jgi:hypothetical protein
MVLNTFAQDVMISSHCESNQDDNGCCFITLLHPMPLHFVRRFAPLVERPSDLPLLYVLELI